MLLHLALVLHFAATLITFCVNITFCGVTTCRAKITGGDKDLKKCESEYANNQPSSACRGYVRATATSVLENSEVKH